MNRRNIPHSPVHDLESTLWILIYHIADTVQRFVTNARKFDEELPDLEDLRDLPQLIDEMPFPGSKQDPIDTDKEKEKGTKNGENSQEAEAGDDEKVHEHKRKASKAIEKEGNLKRHRSDVALQIDNDGEAHPGNDDVEMGEAGILENTPYSVPPDAELPPLPYEPLARELLKMLEPVPDAQTYAKTREFLLQNFDKMIESNVSLSPFRPLLRQLRQLAAEYYMRSVQMQRQDARNSFSPDEVEEAFARYLEAFRVNMPLEEGWWYMKKYIQGIQEAHSSRQRKVVKV